MNPRSLPSRRALAPIALVVAVVLLAISPRALLAPALSFNRAQESKRPKTPKNVVRTESTSAPNAERHGRQAKVDHPTPGPQELHDLRVRVVLAPPVPEKASRELTKPDYLKPFGGSPPRAALAPPA